jgi:hypothetical protein
VKVSRVVAATGIAIGLSAFAAPSALADVYLVDSDGGDVAIQDVGAFSSGNNTQIANNDFEVKFRGFHGNKIGDQVKEKINSSRH